MLTQRRELLRAYVRDYKEEKGCQHCGLHHPAALDLHHREKDEKEASISKMVNSGASLARIMVELKKCDVLCANCHRIHHYENG